MGGKSKAKEKKTVYRPGDKVRIVKPNFFVRCGYERDLSSEIDVVLEKFGEDIHKLMLTAGVLSDRRVCRHRGAEVGRVRYRIAAELAHARLRVNGFGSRVRRLYTETESVHEGAEATVWGKKTVKTGEYYAPSGWGDDYDPGCLLNERTHVILRVQLGYTGTFKWIEAANVEAIEA